MKTFQRLWFKNFGANQIIPHPSESYTFITDWWIFFLLQLPCESCCCKRSANELTVKPLTVLLRELTSKTVIMLNESQGSRHVCRCSKFILK